MTEQLGDMTTQALGTASAKRLDEVLSRINARRRTQAGRALKDAVQLVAVSKTFDALTGSVR